MDKHPAHDTGLTPHTAGSPAPEGPRATRHAPTAGTPNTRAGNALPPDVAPLLEQLGRAIVLGREALFLLWKNTALQRSIAAEMERLAPRARSVVLAYYGPGGPDVPYRPPHPGTGLASQWGRTGPLEVLSPEGGSVNQALGEAILLLHEALFLVWQQRNLGVSFVPGNGSSMSPGALRIHERLNQLAALHQGWGGPPLPSVADSLAMGRETVLPPRQGAFAPAPRWSPLAWWRRWRAGLARP